MGLPRQTLVLGAGRTGQAVARAFAARGVGVRLADIRSREALALDGTPRGVELRLGEDGEHLLAGVDLVVPSPGIPSGARLLAAARARGIPVRSEIEVACALLDCPILAITGTNGKSTTTTLVGLALERAGRRTFTGGNLGTPLITALERAPEIAVVEVSSFQLEWVDRFRPKVACLLNLSPDHLDRHGSFPEYRDAKARLMQLGLLGDMAIDITQGTEASGRAKDGEMFAGERTPDLGEAAAKMLEVIKPVATEATNTMKDLQQTAQNLNRLTDENSELTLALTQFKTFGEHLSDLTAPESALSHSLTNIEKISTSLTENNNIEVTLRNLRTSSEKLKVATTELGPAGQNIKQFSETIKTQPWRLIWPTTKKYAEASPTPGPAQGTITVRKSARGRSRPSATPTSRTSSR